MAKQKDYGYKTPVRRGTNNITGNKVGGSYSGGDCKIVPFLETALQKNNSKSEFIISKNSSVGLFNKEISVFAVGGFFLPSEAVTITLEIELAETISETIEIEKDHFEKIGLAIDIDRDELESVDYIKCRILIEGMPSTSIKYWGFDFGFVDNEYLKTNDVHDVFFNSKRKICFPEQFFFDNSKKILPTDNISSFPLIVKSCNRCQRFLPINHISERKQLSFSNHCSSKAPCKHGNFSNYKIENTFIRSDQLNNFIKSTPYTLSDDFVISFYGHQLECKACKKFFVNSALNHLRTSTQHREDALRRRAFELLTRDLLGMEWIYHSFRTNYDVEFDKFIWEKFDKKCFNCGVGISDPKKMDLDHTMPLAGLYPLDETATCLCPSCNSSKSDLYPLDFYSSEKLLELGKITGIPISLLNSRRPNQAVLDQLENKLDWFFNDFLKFEEYTKVRDGKRVADSIIHSLQKVINKSERPFALVLDHD